MTSTPPESDWLVAGLVILDPPARTLSTTRLSDTLTYPATVLASLVLVVICPGNGAVSGLHIVAVILWAGESPLVLIGRSLQDLLTSAAPHLGGLVALTLNWGGQSIQGFPISPFTNLFVFKPI